METTITQINEVEYELSVSAGAEELKPEIDKSIRSQRGKVNLKGFRPGKVPFSMVKNLVGEAIAFEFIEKRILETYEAEVLKPESYDVIGMPNITLLDFKMDGDLNAKLRFGVRPSFELNDLSKVTIPKVVHKVEDKEIDEQIHKMRLDRADLRTRDEGGIEDSDWVKIDLQHLDKESNAPIIGDREEGVSFFMDDENLKDELREALLGKKAGDAFRVNLPMEEDADPTKKKESAETAPPEPYEVLVQEVQIRELPELDEVFIKEVTRDEAEDEKGLRDHLKSLIEESWQRQSRELLQGEFRLKLLELHEFPVPENAVESQMNAYIEDMKKRNDGQLPEGFDVDAFREANNEDVVKQIRWMLIRDKIVKDEELEVSDEDYNNYFKKMAGDNEDLVGSMRSYYENAGMLDNLTFQLMDDKLQDTLESKFKIKEMDIEKYKKELEKRKDDA